MGFTVLVLLLLLLLLLLLTKQAGSTVGLKQLHGVHCTNTTTAATTATTVAIPLRRSHDPGTLVQEKLAGVVPSGVSLCAVEVTETKYLFVPGE